MKKQKTKVKAKATSSFQMRGEIEFSVYKGDRFLYSVKEKNLIVDLGYETVRQRLSAVAANLYITKVGFGIGTVAPDPGDTGITSGFIKALDGVTYPDQNKVVFEWALEFAEYNGNDVTEFALFSEDGTTIFSRVTRAPIAKDVSIRLEGTWTIIF